MPEGDTIFRAARTLNRVLAGTAVTRFESVFPALTRVAEDHPIVGRTIDSVTSAGKHLLVTFSGDLVLRTHMRMNGSWHVYPVGEKWRRPSRDMRIVIGTSRAVAVGFNIPVAEFLTSWQIARHRELRALGPDLLDPAFDAGAARGRIRSRGREPIGEVLLNQRVVAGIGNVLKNEILFVAGVNPFAPVDTLTESTVARLVDTSVALLKRNVAEQARTLAPTIGRRTTSSMHPDKGLWVYGRAGKPCRRCRMPIEVRQAGPDARLTYWCPSCQAAPG